MSHILPTTQANLKNALLRSQLYLILLKDSL